MGRESDETIPKPDEPTIMEFAYHVTGKRRKELVKAVIQITGMPL